MSTDCSFKTLTSPGSNEILQSHNSLTFKLLKTGELSRAYFASQAQPSLAG